MFGRWPELSGIVNGRSAPFVSYSPGHGQKALPNDSVSKLSCECRNSPYYEILIQLLARYTKSIASQQNYGQSQSLLDLADTESIGASSTSVFSQKETSSPILPEPSSKKWFTIPNTWRSSIMSVINERDEQKQKRMMTVAVRHAIVKRSGFHNVCPHLRA